MTAVDLDTLRSLNTKQVSELTGISISALRMWRHRGVGPKTVKVVGVVLYPVADLNEWLEQQKAAS